MKMKVIFCQKCGTKLVPQEFPADQTIDINRTIKPFSLLGGSGFVCYPSFSIKTGKRNMFLVYQCPNRFYKVKEGFFKRRTVQKVDHSHSSFTDHKTI